MNIATGLRLLPWIVLLLVLGVYWINRPKKPKTLVDYMMKTNPEYGRIIIPAIVELLNESNAHYARIEAEHAASSTVSRETF